MQIYANIWMTIQRNVSDYCRMCYWKRLLFSIFRITETWLINWLRLNGTYTTTRLYRALKKLQF